MVIITLWKKCHYCVICTLKKILLQFNLQGTLWRCQYCLMSGKVCSTVWDITPWNCKYGLIWNQTKFLLLLVVIVWNCEYFCIYLFIFLPNVLLLYALGFHTCIFWPLGWLWLNNNFIYRWFSWSFSLQFFPAWFPVEMFLWFI